MGITQTVSLGDYWNSFIQKKLEEGQYTSMSEVLREGLRLLEGQERNNQKLQKLREALLDGEKSGSAGILNLEKIKKEAMEKRGLIE
ncbi:Type II toxin-antitoxin system ParD family antitoxin [Candidatus Hepatincolaceae symbiont of Richtersius coronifer]